MNKLETAEAIKVMQAWIDNEPIQIQDVGSNQWRPIGTEYQGASQPSWAWFSATYRIKPREPREFWIHSDFYKELQDLSHGNDDLRGYVTTDQTFVEHNQEHWTKVCEIL